MPEHNPGQLGGTMRLGRRRTVFSETHESKTSKTKKLSDPLKLMLRRVGGLHASKFSMFRSPLERRKFF